MIADLKRDVVRNAIWFSGLGLVLLALLGGTLWHLLREREEVQSIQSSIQRKRASLTTLDTAASSAETLVTSDKELRSWSEMIDSEPRRIAALSSAARASGVTLVSLENSQPRVGADDSLLTCSHTLQGVGSYAQLATFFDQVYATDGMAAINQLEVRPDNDLAAGTLHASLNVAWYALGADAGDSEAEASE